MPATEACPARLSPAEAPPLPTENMSHLAASCRAAFHSQNLAGSTILETDIEEYLRLRFKSHNWPCCQKMLYNWLLCPHTKAAAGLITKVICVVKLQAGTGSKTQTTCTEMFGTIDSTYHYTIACTALRSSTMHLIQVGIKRWQLGCSCMSCISATAHHAGMVFREHAAGCMQPSDVGRMVLCIRKCSTLASNTLYWW